MTNALIHKTFVVIQCSHACVINFSINTQVMDGHASRVFSLKYHPTDPYMLISGGWDDTVQVRIACNPSIMTYFSITCRNMWISSHYIYNVLYCVVLGYKSKAFNKVCMLFV